MANKVEGSVAFLNSDHPGATEGEGFYEVTKDNVHKMTEDENPTPYFDTDGVGVEFGKKVNWVKDTPDDEGENDPENNEGHWEYADADEDEDAEGDEE